MGMKLLFAVLFSLLFTAETYPNYDVKLTDVFFDGGFVFFPVNKARLQKRLDEINDQFHNDIDQLVLPSESVLQKVIGKEEHVIMVGFGRVDAVAFDGVLTNAEEQTESTQNEGLTIAIPYLTTKKGKESITFQMALYTSEGGHHIESNVVMPTPIVADSLSRHGNEFFTEIEFRKDDLHLQLVGEHNVPCVPHGEQDVEDVKAYEHELQISLHGAEFSVCDQYDDLHVDLCDLYRDPFYNAVLEEADTNICQYWEPTEDVHTCDSTFHVLQMSKAMRELLLLEEGQDVFEGISQAGTFDIRLVFPCIE